MDGVRDELARLRLSKYAPAFEEGGYDVWPEILRLPPIRLARLLEMLQRATTRQAPPAAERKEMRG